jgi:hypothetical protein
VSDVALAMGLSSLLTIPASGSTDSARAWVQKETILPVQICVSNAINSSMNIEVKFLKAGAQPGAMSFWLAA